MATAGLVSSAHGEQLYRRLLSMTAPVCKTLPVSDSAKIRLLSTAAVSHLRPPRTVVLLHQNIDNYVIYTAAQRDDSTPGSAGGSNTLRFHVAASETKISVRADRGPRLTGAQFNLRWIIHALEFPVFHSRLSI